MPKMANPVRKRNRCKPNPARKALLKRALKKGVDAKNAMLQAGYHPNTAHTATARKIVKDCYREIEIEFKASELTPDFVINGLIDLRKLCIKGKKKDLSTAVRIHELYGKYLKMWSDTQNNLILINTKANQFTLSDRVKKLKDE